MKNRETGNHPFVRLDAEITKATAERKANLISYLNQLHQELVKLGKPKDYILQISDINRAVRKKTFKVQSGTLIHTFAGNNWQQILQKAGLPNEYDLEPKTEQLATLKDVESLILAYIEKNSGKKPTDYEIFRDFAKQHSPNFSIPKEMDSFLRTYKQPFTTITKRLSVKYLMDKGPRF